MLASVPEAGRRLKELCKGPLKDLFFSSIGPHEGRHRGCIGGLGGRFSLVTAYLGLIGSRPPFAWPALVHRKEEG